MLTFTSSHLTEPADVVLHMVTTELITAGRHVTSPAHLAVAEYISYR